jgi:Rad3-related DNA helicase
MTWSLYEGEKELKPIIYSNGKSQKDIVKEVIDAVESGNKVIFIKGMPGTGKSAVALNLARKFGKTSIVVPIKSLQEQYLNDYSGKKYLIKQKKLKIKDFPELASYPGLKQELEKEEKLKISSIVGRKNFKCRFLEENSHKDYSEKIIKKEKNSNLFEIFEKKDPLMFHNTDLSCNNDYLPCKIEIKEKNLERIKEYIKENPLVHISDFGSIDEIKRTTIASICPYWSPILPSEYPKMKDGIKQDYTGLNKKKFSLYKRKPGCPYYEQYQSYSDADVLIFNSLKYKLESLMDRKPMTEVEIIDECDEFLDSFSIEENINLNKLTYAVNQVFYTDEKIKKLMDELLDIINTIKVTKKFENNYDIFPVEDSIIEELLRLMTDNSDIMDMLDLDESSYVYHLDMVARTFSGLLDETFFSIEKKENNFIINLVTINLEKRFKELLDKNKVLIMMSGTIHKDSVIKGIFGISDYKIIDAETKNQGNLIKSKFGYELDCSYQSFKSGKVTREQYLKALSSSISCAKKPVLVHVTAFSDLPDETEKINYNLTNLMTSMELLEQQKQDPLGKRINDFKNKKFDVLFTTKCSRGIDFPGEQCNSIVITRFPYPNISTIFWKILKKNKPTSFMSFYMDKANRELLQRIYRGLRSKNDTVYLLSPDKRVLEFKIE